MDICTRVSCKGKPIGTELFCERCKSDQLDQVFTGKGDSMSWCYGGCEAYRDIEEFSTDARGFPFVKCSACLKTKNNSEVVRVRPPFSSFPRAMRTPRYVVASPADERVSASKLMTTKLPEGLVGGPDRLFFCGIPFPVTELQLTELFESVGTLKSLYLAKDRVNLISRGFGFCVFEDSSKSIIAILALDGLHICGRTLTVEYAYRPADTKPTKILCLPGVITVDEIADDDLLFNIVIDMREEGSKFGELLNVAIPGPSPTGELRPGVGNVYLEYNDRVGSYRARAGLNGRMYNGKPIVAGYFPEHKYARGEY